MSSQVVLMSEYLEGIPELKSQSEDMRFAGKYWRRGVVSHSWKKIRVFSLKIFFLLGKNMTEHQQLY